MTNFTFTRVTGIFEILVDFASLGRHALFKVPDTEYFEGLQIFSSFLLAFLVNGQNIWVLPKDTALNGMVNKWKMSVLFGLSETSHGFYRIF